MTYNAIEQEAIILNAVWKMIDEMVNFAIIMPIGPETKNLTLFPRTDDTRRIFHILLGDFLSPLVSRGGSDLPFGLAKTSINSRQSDYSFLLYLRQVISNPQLGNATNELASCVESFSVWLEQDTHIETVWLPSIDVEVDLDIARMTWIKICADIGKHSFARLEGNVTKITGILRSHGKLVDEGMGYTVLPEFWEWFHDHLFGYHMSTIAEFLNNIRWAIHGYLRSEFVRAYHETGEHSGIKMYAFHYPAGVTAPLAKTMYWDVMNMARSIPFFPRFTVTPHLKSQF
jgi:hypothetical protein